MPPHPPPPPHEGNPGARRALGGRGRQLHTHEVHLRRTKNKGYIARHDMRDSRGNPPDDGQRPEVEYSLANKEAMLAHMAQHMGDPPAPDGDDGGPPAPPDDGPDGPGGPPEPPD